MPADELSYEENIRLLDRLFPNGFAGAEIKAELIPQGWEHSSLRFIFHPTAKQSYDEMVQQRKNISEIFKDEKNENDLPEFDEFKKEYSEKPIQSEKELWDLMGLCVWDIFSNNHEVIAPDGRIANLGSFRGSGSFIALWIEGREETDERYGYLDFYMGSALVSQRADLSPVYRMIFKRLRTLGFDWSYSFPRVYLFDPSKGERENPEDYDPLKALTEKQESDDLKKELDEIYRESAAKAREGEPPSIVQAYAEAYGELPEGWPPE